MNIIKPPDKKTLIKCPAIFLAGSIEMDKAEKWQDIVIEALSDLGGTILNPRRDNWDSSWAQDILNPKFKEQVIWELGMLHKADYIALYFDPNTKSPISLLELGLFSNTGKLIVCCPEGFWRKGNVDITCEYYNISQVKNLEEMISLLRKKILLNF